LEKVRLADWTVKPVQFGAEFWIVVTVSHGGHGVSGEDGVTLESRAAGYLITPKEAKIEIPAGVAEYTCPVRVTVTGTATASAVVDFTASAGNRLRFSVEVTPPTAGQ